MSATFYRKRSAIKHDEIETAERSPLLGTFPYCASGQEIDGPSPFASIIAKGNECIPDVRLPCPSGGLLELFTVGRLSLFEAVA